MFKNKEKIFTLFCWYILLVIVTWLFNQSLGKADYNGIWIGLSAILCLILSSDKFIVFFSSFAFILLIPFSEDVFHPLMDSIIIVFVLTTLKISLDSKILYKNICHVYRISFILLCLSIIAYIPPFATISESGRAMGIAHSTNVSSSIVSLMGILCWEAYKKVSHYNSLKLYFFGGIFLLVFMFSKTRSLLFFFPYWLYQFYMLYPKLFYVGLGISVLIAKVNYMDSISEEMRLAEDGSSITRGYLYENMIVGILNNKLVIPHGSNTATELARQITGSDEFSPHNDFLRYLYDWGALFLLFGMICIKYIKRCCFKSNKVEVIFILISLSSCALHNILFLHTVWLAFIIILSIRKYESVSSFNNSQKIQ